MLVVAGLSLKNLKPRVWDPASPDYLPQLGAVMLSYAEIAARPMLRRAMMDKGLRKFLGLPDHIQVYLDNGAFALLRRRQEPAEDYAEFVRAARPDWWPVPCDYIPAPWMSPDEQRERLHRTMAMNRAYGTDGYVPVIHASALLEEYVAALREEPGLAAKPAIALGGLVPNLLRARQAPPYDDVLRWLVSVRTAFLGKQIHVFGIGGTATLHLVALLGMDSIDSSAWRARAARGLIQLPGSGERMVAELGNWRGRALSAGERQLLEACQCPACRQAGMNGLRQAGLEGFRLRALHNLWVLLEEAREVTARLSNGSYPAWYETHLDNTIYLPLIRRAVAWRFGDRVYRDDTPSSPEATPEPERIAHRGDAG